MSNTTKILFLGAAKWCIIIAFGGLMFYAVYPKYFVTTRGEMLRINKISGKVEHYGDYGWVETTSFDQRMKERSREKETSKVFEDLDK